MKQVNDYDYNLFEEISFLVVVTGMTFLTRAAIKINRKLLSLEFPCLNEWIIVFRCSELTLKKAKKTTKKQKNKTNKLCYFFNNFPLEFLHFCRMTHTQKQFSKSISCL